jgi:hypothetical protein
MRDDKPSWLDEIILGVAIAVTICCATGALWLACGGGQ